MEDVQCIIDTFAMSCNLITAEMKLALIAIHI